MPARESQPPQLSLQILPDDPTLAARDQILPIYPENAVHLRRIQTDDGARFRFWALNRTGNCRATSKGNDDQVVFRCDGNNPDDVVMSVGPQDDVRDSSVLAFAQTVDVVQGVSVRSEEAVDALQGIRYLEIYEVLEFFLCYVRFGVVALRWQWFRGVGGYSYFYIEYVQDPLCEVW